MKKTITVLTDGKLKVKSNQNHPEKKVKDLLLDYDSVLLNLTDNWGTLTNQDKTQALRAGLVLALKIIRLVWKIILKDDND